MSHFLRSTPDSLDWHRLCPLRTLQIHDNGAGPGAPPGNTPGGYRRSWTDIFLYPRQVHTDVPTTSRSVVFSIRKDIVTGFFGSGGIRTPEPRLRPLSRPRDRSGARHADAVFLISRPSTVIGFRVALPAGQTWEPNWRTTNPPGPSLLSRDFKSRPTVRTTKCPDSPRLPNSLA